MSKIPFLLILLSAVLPFASSTSQAGEPYFGRVYTAETMPQGRFEIEQVVRNRSGRAFGSYSAFDFRTEIEYGITDQLQAAIYINTGSMAANGAPDDDDPNGVTGFQRKMFFLQGVSAEFIYRVLSPFSDGIGLAFYVEPEFMFHDQHNGLEYDLSFETEYRVIVQKNFLDDQLILAYNMVAEIEFIRFKGNSDYKGELDWNHELGATYRFFPQWYAGIEARNHNEIGNFITHEHSLLWAGPVFHFGSEKVWATLSILRQIYGAPNGTNAAGTFLGNNEFLRSHEQYEITAKVGFPF